MAKLISTRLFQAMATNLNSCRPDLRDVVLCPMCLKQIGLDKVGALSVEHIVPRRLGGSCTTLTCRKPCNNDFGHQAQSHLVTLLKVNEAFRGRGDFRGSFTVANERFPVAVGVRTRGMEMTALGGHPATFAAVQQSIRNRPQPWSLNVNLGYKPGRTSVAIMRTAYLTAFHQYGYEYILAEPADALRREILSAMTEHSGRLCQLTGTMPGAFELTGNEPEALTIPLTLEDGPSFLFVPMKFVFNNRGYWMFSVLPAPEQNASSMFEDLHRAITALGKHDLHMEGEEDGSVRVELSVKPERDSAEAAASLTVHPYPV